MRPQRALVVHCIATPVDYDVPMKLLPRRFQFVLTSGSDAEVSRAIMRAATLNAIPQLLVWGGLYWWYGQQQAAAALIGWAAATTAIPGAYCFRTDWMKPLVPLQLAGVMAINAAVTFFLGGLVQSYGQFTWGFLAPMAALICYGPRPAVAWFAAYVVILFALAPLSSAASPPLPSWIGQLMTALNLSITGTFIFVGMRYFITKKNHFYDLLQKEEQKSQSLLLNILPAPIAAILKEDRGTIAAEYDQASILFFDLVGFTSLSERLGASATVEMLNAIFSRFDDLVDRYGLEKIKTIGDSYMVAAGLPTPRDDHAPALVSLALELGEVTRAYAREWGGDISFRTGVHSGPVTAGVIGKRKFAFDVWGDTVNVASRMESHGVPGKVHVSEATYRLVEANFECEPRGEVEIKGKGPMRTWIVVEALK